MKVEPWAWVLRAQKMRVQIHLHDWLSQVRLGYQGVSYWVVPWGATQTKAGVEAEPDDGRWLGGPFGATQLICYHP